MGLPSRIAAVVTNLRCNQSCTYCASRSPVDDRAFIAPASVRARIDAGIAAGATEILFTGGEPTMRGDLPALVAHARAAGARRVVLETNATLVDLARARALGQAGVDLVRVNLAGWGESLDAVTRDPGGFERTRAGLAALAEAGISIEVLAALVRSTREGLPELPGHLAEPWALGRVRGIEVAVPFESPDPGEQLCYDDAAEAVRSLDAAARAVAIPLRFHPAYAIPPCVFPPGEQRRFASLYALAPGSPRLPRHTQVEACRSCVVSDRCSGLPDAYLARRPVPAMHPVREEKTRRRLTMIGSLEEQIARELVSSSYGAGAGGEPVVDAIVRINFHCNQACTFCFVSTHLPPAGADRVEAAIVDAGQRGERIVLSGGEPTLHARLVEYVRLARRVSRHGVSLQTNAIRLDDAGLTQALADAGLEEAFVSLHGATAEVSDEITQAPGTFVRTLAGLDNLARTDVRIGLNFVACTNNQHELVPVVRLAAERWPRAYLNLSFVAASTDLVPRDRDLIPRYSDVMPHVAEAATLAQALGVKLTGIESMCGLPLCLVPQELDLGAPVDKPAGFDQGEFLKVEACHGCRYQTRCWGIRRTYAALHGTSELRTVP